MHHISRSGLVGLAIAASLFVAAPAQASTAPALTLADPGGNPAALAGTTDAAGTVTVSILSGADLLQTLTATPASGAYSVTPATLLDGTYTARATQTDAAGEATTTPVRTFLVDKTAPTIDISAIRTTYTRGETVAAVFTCADANGIAACDGPATIDTSTAGERTLVVTARDTLGNTRTASVVYTVTVPPLQLGIVLGAPTQFAPFVVGVARDYTSTATATLTTTATAASFTVVDGSATAPGHLVNGIHPLSTALRAQAASAAGSSPGAGDIGASPLTLLNYAGPAGNDAVNLTFTQRIGAGDVLRTGIYAKTLTFTLAATTP